MAFFVPYFLTSFRRISMGLPHLADIMVAKGSAAQKGGGLKGGADWASEGEVAFRERWGHFRFRVLSLIMFRIRSMECLRQ